jgi:hypothetical protein
MPSDAERHPTSLPRKMVGMSSPLSVVIQNNSRPTGISRCTRRRTITVGSGTARSRPTQTSAMPPAGSHGASGTDRTNIGKSTMRPFCIPSRSHRAAGAGEAARDDPDRSSGGEVGESHQSGGVGELPHRLPQRGGAAPLPHGRRLLGACSRPTGCARRHLVVGEGVEDAAHHLGWRQPQRRGPAGAKYPSSSCAYRGARNASFGTSEKVTAGDWLDERDRARRAGEGRGKTRQRQPR